ncbi:response regulator [Undibacterium sp.]|uniref:response regulator n=1 Tax=Undibacterium sp. TaxID=1914977 RepID=UPI002B7AC41B|nr:response regulator [Undibacterium sp.]HTD06317.1 response regulator [Undibacterium sp.]
MTLNHQSNILAWLAAIAVAVVIAVTALSVIEVRSQGEQVTMAENTVKGITQFRFLIMETTFYSEQRSIDQWQRHITSFGKMLAAQRYSEANENALLDREQSNLKVLSRLYERLANTASFSTTPLRVNATTTELTTSTVSALFLTTQDMSEDAFELVRLNRLDLAAAQDQALLIMQFSIAALAALIAAGCVIIKRRVLVPVAALQRGTEQVTKGDLSFRLNLGVANEIGSLANTFDHMTEQLGESRDSMQATVQTLANKSNELKRAQLELQTIIDQMPALVGSWDANFHNRFGNRAYFDWFGIEPEKMRGQHMQEIIGKDRFQQLEPYLLSVLQGSPVVFERTIDHPSGEERHAVFSYVPDMENGEVKGFYGFVSDVTQLKKAQLANEKALAQLQGIVDAAKDFAIIEGDEEGTITLFSKGAEIMLGYTADEIVGKTHAGIFHVKEEIVVRGSELSLKYGRPIRGFDVFVELPRQGESESREWTYIHKDGTAFPVNLTITAIRNRLGNITGYLGIAKNIQKDKDILRTLAETRDKAQAASLSKSQFLANMSHEIRTPMNAILGMLQLLQYTELTTRQLDYTVKTETAAQSLLSLLNDILDFSKVEADKMTLEHVPFRLDTLMRDLSVIFASSVGSKDIEVLFSLDSQLPDRILGDALRLRQILINLAGNAIKFTQHGEVVVSIQVLTQNSDHTEIQFSVRDTGIGIAPEHLVQVFEGFSQAEASTTRRFGGTGLGLAISQRLVALMGGELEVESTLGCGSHFHFILTFKHAKEGDAAGLQASLECIEKVLRRALIVDDNDSAREYLLSMVESLGWQGDGAASGADALAMLRQGAEDRLPYDVVFMDWKMPGMDGWESTRQIRQLQQGNKTPVVIMVTAYGREILEERSESDRDLINGLLVKPVTASMLFDALMEASHQPINAATKLGAKRLAGIRLLVVEDTLMNQQVAQELLSNEGAIVELADSGGAGVEKTLAASPSYDAVLMDIQMPDMDGYEATKKIRQDTRMQSLPIIAMTANAMASDKATCLAAGMNDHLAKPIDLDEVVTTILRHCKHDNPLGAAAPPAEIVTLPQDASAIELDRALQRLGGNKALFFILVQRFSTDIPGMVVDFRQHLEQGDRNKAANVMHTLKGIAGTMGATQLAKYAADAETQLRAADADIDTNAMSEGLGQLVAQAKAALEIISLDVQPVAAAGPAQLENPDRTTLGSLLDELDTLLHSANMQAIGVFAEFKKKYGDDLGDKILPLSQAIQSLNFKLALECSRQLRTEL